MLVRLLERRDVESVMTIQAACPEIAQWTVWDYARVAKGEMAGWVAESKPGVVIGFLVARRIASDIEILNFAVQTASRRHGIGSALLRESLRWAKSFDAQRAFLEVRVSNLAAIRFYELNHFEVTGRRPRYYTEPIEDALLLAAPLYNYSP